MISALFSFFASDAKNPESIPPLKQKASGTSDRNLKDKLDDKSDLTFSIISLYLSFSFGLKSILKYFLLVIFKLKSKIKFVPGSREKYF